MEKKRRKKRLTSKQAILLIIGIVFIYYAILTIRCPIDITKVDESLVISIIEYWMALPLAIYALLYYAIFKVEERKMIEENEEHASEVKKSLSREEFTEVEFVLEKSGSAIDMVKQILQKEECKFYAKLSENNNVIIVAKDKHNEEVYKGEIDYYTYFYHTFKLHSD